MKGLSLGIFYLLLPIVSYSQDVLSDEIFMKNGYDSSFFAEQERPKRMAIPYDEVREADVFFKHRVWREIDTREKQNLPFRYPKQPLAAIIHTAAKNGELIVYENLPAYGYDFHKTLSVAEVQAIGRGGDSNYQINPLYLTEELVYNPIELDWGDIVKFRVMEDWFFDEETSTFNVRIIGMAPIREVKVNGVYVGDELMYWLYFPELRNILVNYDAYNPENEAEQLSWDDVFHLRLFDSYITREENVYDRAIADYASGLDAILESDRIHRELVSFENSLWDY